MRQSRRGFLDAAGGLGPAFAQERGKPDAWPPAATKSLLEFFGLRVPVFQAGFGTVTSVALAAAVSNAGAMGALGALNARQRIEGLKATTRRSGAPGSAPIGSKIRSSRPRLFLGFDESLENDPLLLSPEQRAELDYRAARYRENPADVTPWKQVRADLHKAR